nr:ferrous iron transport protein B [bacterium]
MPITLALAGNPNCGKTTLFNALTGSTQHVGNWPGVTVEKKEGSLKGKRDVTLVDLPGIYSLSPYSPEERVSRTFLLNNNAGAVISIVDASNLERNLLLTTQLLELGIPIVVALNMMDVVEKNGGHIDAAALSRRIGCPVVPISALKGKGLKELGDTALSAAKGGIAPPPLAFDGEVETALQTIQGLIHGLVAPARERWVAIKLFERDEDILSQTALDPQQREVLANTIAACESSLDDDAVSLITDQRYRAIAHLTEGCIARAQGRPSISDSIDKVVTNRYLALPIFAVIMFLVYFLSVTTIGSMATDWVNDSLFGEFLPGALTGWLESIHCADWLISLLVDGILAGIGAVLGFLPQMLVLFFLLAVLEDSGYMARIAFILDRLFRRFGLSGKSFIPMLIGTGCGVPGIMASRTIESPADRRMTVMTTTFIPCSAKLPIIALIAGALFGGAWWVAPSAYFVGIAAIILSGILLKKTKLFAGEAAPFVMELPAYHLPGLKGVLVHMWERGKSFVKKAGTIIFLASGLVWLLSSFNWRFEMVEETQSMLADIGGVIAPLFAPLGFGDWRAAVAMVTGLVAKENVVSTFGILYGFAEVAEDGAEIWANLQAAFSPLAAYGFLVFNLLCAPCFAAIGAMKREFGSARWTLFAVGYQTGLAYTTSFCIYQLGTWISGGGFGLGTAASLVVLAGFLYLLLRPARRTPQSLATT